MLYFGFSDPKGFVDTPVRPPVQSDIGNKNHRLLNYSIIKQSLGQRRARTAKSALCEFTTCVAKVSYRKFALRFIGRFFLGAADKRDLRQGRLRAVSGPDAYSGRSRFSPA